MQKAMESFRGKASPFHLARAFVLLPVKWQGAGGRESPGLIFPAWPWAAWAASGPDNERERPQALDLGHCSSIAGSEVQILRGWAAPGARCDPRQSDTLVGKPCLSAKWRFRQDLWESRLSEFPQVAL